MGNPGALRWMSPMAGALSGAGLLRLYLTPLAQTAALERRLRLGPAVIADRLRSQLALRAIPEGVAEDQVQLAAPAHEVVTVVASRSGLPEPLVRAVRSRRARAFDHAVARRLLGGDVAVIASFEAGLATLRRARALGVPSFLDYPIAHHRFSERILEEEARRVPAYARTLQFGRVPASQRARLDEELAMAERIFVFSSFQWRTFVEAGVDAARLVLTPLGVDLDLFAPAPREPDGPGFRVLFVGQITQRKGISYLVDGYERAAIPDSDLTLLGRIVGNAPWRGRPGVSHAAAVPHPQLPAQYVSRDVFVLPSLVEGFPQTALEAMACGLPVIVSENTFGTDVVTDGVDGYVVPTRDAGAIAERLRHLHANPAERLRMGAAARRRAQDFAWERYGQRIVAAVRAVT